jgi:hypothetical protein
MRPPSGKVVATTPQAAASPRVVLLALQHSLEPARKHLRRENNARGLGASSFQP